MVEYNSVPQKATSPQNSTQAEKYTIEDLSPQQLDHVKVALEITPGAKILKTAAVKSHDNPPWSYYVGASFTAPGINEPMIAVWVMSGTKDKPGLTSSVNGIAYEYSKMGMAQTTQAPVFVTDKEYEILEKNLK